MLTWSNSARESLNPPETFFAMVNSASSVILIFSRSDISLRRLIISSVVILLKSNLWHLETIVSRTLWGSVVAKIKITFFGGSSKVFKSALKASFESMWTSSMIKILYLPLIGAYWTWAIKSFASWIPRFEAASISITSSPVAFVISTQLAHFWQGSSVGPCSQFRDFARILALEVLPVPLGPQNK